MRGFFAVASREIVERRRVFVAAAVAALFPLFAPLLPAARRFGAPEARLYTAAFFAVAFSAALSLILGMTAIGRDLSERRLGFYFSRPIGNAAIWAGKLAGIGLQVLLAALLILLPAGLVDLATWWRETRMGLAAEIGVAFVFAVVVFLALGKAISLALRSRPAWVAGDVVAFALWLLAMGTISLPLLVARAPVVLQRLGLVVAIACAVALLAAGGAQVSIGRVDPVRGTRARFAVLWGLLFAIAGLFAGFTRWLLRPAPSELSSVLVRAAAPAGSWIGVEGRARGRADLRVSLFYDVASGGYVRGWTGREGSAVVSADGTTAAWTQASGIFSDGPQDVWACRLAAGAPGTRTPISERIGNIAISPEGSRLAIAGERALGIYEIPSGRLLGSIALDSDERFSRFVFVGRDRLRLFRIPSAAVARAGEELATIEVSDFDVPARRLVERVAIPNLHRPFSLAFDDRDGRVLVWEKGSALSLFDLASSRFVRVLGNFAWGATSRAFLSDGRIAVAEASAGMARVHLFSKNGEPERVFEAGQAGLVRLGAEPSAGTLAVSVGPAPYVWGASDSFLLDLRDGKLRKLGKHLEPVAAHMRWRLPQPEPGSAASLLFSRNDGALLRFDPATGKLVTVFRGR